MRLESKEMCKRTFNQRFCVSTITLLRTLCVKEIYSEETLSRLHIFNAFKRNCKNKMSWIRKTNEYKFMIFFTIAIIVMFIIFVWNLISGEKGTYVDHTSMIWDLLGKSVKNNNRSKTPFESKGESECRRAIEHITQLPFPKVRPNFLNNHISGQSLELDCFNGDMKLAIEYNGEQHYKFIPHFHSNKDSFYNMRYRDDMKMRLCKENGVDLIVVPYTVKRENIQSFIEKKLYELRPNWRDKLN